MRESTKKEIFRNTVIFVISWMKCLIFMAMGVRLIFRFEVRVVMRFIIVRLFVVITMFLVVFVI